jgi:hypothetical protein
MTGTRHFMVNTFASAGNVVKTSYQTDHTPDTIVRRVAKRRIVNARKSLQMRKVTNRTMTLYHVTHKNNWFPVRTMGLIAEFSQSRRETVFLVTKSKIGWAISHVAKRDGLPESEYIVVTVRVRRSKLTRMTWPGLRRGLWRHAGNVPAHRVEWVDSYPERTLIGFLPEGVYPLSDECEGIE